MKYFYILCFIVVVLAEDNEEFRKIDAIEQEEPCLEAGGICSIAPDCPPGHLSEIRGLCPTQKTKGIECCHGLSLKETRCSKHGGRCFKTNEFCNARQLYDEATDCPENTRCCIMVA